MRVYVSAKQVRQDHVPMLINRSLLKLCQFTLVKNIIPECNNSLHYSLQSLNSCSSYSEGRAIFLLDNGFIGLG